jgi:UDP-N-acetylglucosamine 1-carboxyvinyltransferase
MDKIVVKGGNKFHGRIKVSGSKNAALPIFTAALLTEENVYLGNVPDLHDIQTMCSLLESHGVVIKKDGHNYQLSATNINNYTAHYDIVRKMRASVLVLGPILARFGQAKVSLPGGCAIGARPVDMHIDALIKMGAEITIEEGYIYAKAQNGLKGAVINFDKISVGATENILMAATLAQGKTIINNAAQEPEIIDLANMLVKMGADISGISTSQLTIIGQKKLNGVNHDIIPDRIEAGTYMVAASIAGGSSIIENIDVKSLDIVIAKLQEAGVEINIINDNSLEIHSDREKLKGFNINTAPFPGFPTDLQAQFVALASAVNGVSVITENIFENRFMHVPELIRMGADITINGSQLVINGNRNRLKGAQVMATDLRASVSLIIAGLVADGQTTVNRVYHLDRGYENLEQKLANCGANIHRLQESA